MGSGSTFDVRIEYRTEYLCREELERLPLGIGFLAQSSDIEVHPTFHGAVYCIAHVSALGIDVGDTFTAGHVQVPEEHAYRFLEPFPGQEVQFG